MNIIDILLDLHLSVNFGGVNVNDIMALISNSTWLLLVKRDVIDFCILTLCPAILP